MAKTVSTFRTEIVEMKNYPGYGIDPDGTVYSKKINGTKRRSVQWKRLNPQRGEKYLMVCLWDGYKKVSKRIHRLVAENIIPNPNNHQLVCHKDGNCLNNKASNLYWGSYKQNQEDRKRHGTDTFIRTNKAKDLKLTAIQVKKIRKLYGKYNFSELGRLFDVTESNIRKIVYLKTWKHI